MSQGRKSLFVVLAVALLLPACAKEPADRDESETAADQAKPPPEARALLMEMATFLAGLDAFSAKMQGGYDVVQESGQKIEFLENSEGHAGATQPSAHRRNERGRARPIRDV